METTTQLSNLQVILNFAETNTGLFIFLCILTIISVFTLFFALYRLAFYIAKKFKGFKLGDKELKCSDDSGNPGTSEAAPESNKETNIAKFTSTIATIIQYSINTGYENSKKRQELFDMQMSHIRESFDIVQTYVIQGYIKQQGTNVDIVKALLNHCIEKTVILQFRHICIADRLAEKTKDGIIEINRNFIDSAFTNLWVELNNLLDYTDSSKDKNKSLLFSEDILLKSLEDQKETFKKMIIGSLEYAYDLAVKFLNEVQENNKVLDDKIQNLLSIHFEGEVEELQRSWLDPNSATPPNNVVGA